MERYKLILLLLLLCSKLTAGVIDDVYKAGMSYETPQQYKRTAEDLIILKLGEKTLTMGAFFYETLLDKKLTIRIKHAELDYDINIYKDTYTFIIKKEF